MPGDTLHVFDRALRRQTVLAPDFTVVRTARLGIAVHAAWPLDPDHVLVNGWSGGAGSPPPPLHVLGIDGTVITSIESVAGGPPPIFYALHPELLVRKAAPGRSGGFWSAALNTYELEGRDRTGAVTQVIRRFPEWIVPWDTTLSVTPAQPPRTAVSDVRDSPDGRLLVLLDVPAADWRAALSDPRSRGDGSQYYEWDPVHAYDTVIEVLDPAAGRLVMTARVAVRLNGFLDAGTVYAYLEDEVGNPSIAVYELVWDQ
jgi:hypothetical protein